MSKSSQNHLQNETSPYLLQHADNPVDWYPWGDEALSLARNTDRPILLSIGYSACHWCHVMAHESFEDKATGALMNQLFVNIKVDREERPDLDRIYQTAHQLLSQRGGGWPLTVFLDPQDQLPFYAGTYFPPTPRFGMPGFTDLLRKIREYFDQHRGQLKKQNTSLQEALAQLTSTEMATGEALSEQIEEAIRRVLSPAALIWRNMSAIRELEGLDRYDEVAFGDVPEYLQINENGLQFEVPAQSGQKTGWFYDQAANRNVMKAYSGGARVLDMFSYVGAWGITAAAHGAEAATCVDASKAAMDQVNINATLNKVQDKLTAVKSDAFEFLKTARQERREFDLVVVDPPAFIKKARDKRNGLEAYRRINEMAMQLLSKDGLLFSCSCSFHLSSNELQRLIQQAARHLDRHVQIISILQQSPDHPAHPAIPETRYLKGFVARVIPTR